MEPLTPPLGKCSKLGCGMMQRYDRCQKQLLAKLKVTWSDDENGVCTQSLFAYGRTVSSLAGINEGDDDSLVSSELFLSSARITSITYNENNVITVFSHSMEWIACFHNFWLLLRPKSFHFWIFPFWLISYLSFALWSFISHHFSPLLSTDLWLSIPRLHSTLACRMKSAW